MAAIDPHISRILPLPLEGRTLTFAASQALFSSARVDAGSTMLLRSLRDRLAGLEAGARVLDLGCGTGVLGLALATLPGVGHVDLVDRDALALGFAAENARRNGLTEGSGEQVTVASSLGVDEVGGVYDLVLSNIPGKAGEPVIASLLEGACAVLRPGGVLAVVVIEPIRDFVAAVFERLRVEVLLRHDTADYGVFHVRPSVAMGVEPAFASGVYDLGRLAVEDERGAFEITTVHGLPYYDREDPVEALLARRLPGASGPSTVLLSNVGQGALAVTMHRMFRDARLVLVDGDLLALRNAHRNLLAHGCGAERIDLRHQPWWDPDDEAARGIADLIVATLGEREGPAAAIQEYLGLANALRAGGSAVIACSSTAGTRLLEGVRLARGLSAARYRHRGTTVLTVTRSSEDG